HIMMLISSRLFTTLAQLHAIMLSCRAQLGYLLPSIIATIIVVLNLLGPNMSRECPGR
ncbi:hypothetical protein BDR07DRAFT_1416170, partial [Suillus spraguei]